MKQSKHFTFTLPLNRTEYITDNGNRKAKTVCFGDMEINGVAYEKEGEITFDIDQLFYIDKATKTYIRQEVDISFYKHQHGNEWPEDVLDATQAHCEWVFADHDEDHHADHEQHLLTSKSAA